MAYNRSIGMLSGDPRGALDPNMYYQRGQALGQQMGSSLGMLAGRDMRTGEQVAAAEMNKFTQILTDPKKTSTELYQAAQQAMQAGYAEAAQPLIAEAEKRKKYETETNNRAALAKKATDLGLDATAEMVLNGGSLDIAQRTIQDEEERKILAKGGRRARIEVAKRYGLSDVVPAIARGDYDDMSDEAWQKWVQGEEADLKAWQSRDGELNAYRVNKDTGKVWDENTRQWVEASALGLRPAPTLTKDVTASSKANDAYYQAMVDNTTDLLEKAKSASSSLNTNRTLESLLDAGMYTGSFATFKTDAIAAAASLGVPEEFLPAGALERVENTQTYQAVVGKAVAEEIKAFGAGTGLSDKDREFANAVAGGKIEMTEEALRHILKVRNKMNLGRIRNYVNNLDDLRENNIIDESAYNVYYGDFGRYNDMVIETDSYYERTEPRGQPKEQEVKQIGRFSVKVK